MKRREETAKMEKRNKVEVKTRGKERYTAKTMQKERERESRELRIDFKEKSKNGTEYTPWACRRRAQAAALSGQEHRC